MPLNAKLNPATPRATFEIVATKGLLFVAHSLNRSIIGVTAFNTSDITGSKALPSVIAVA